jgi:predicted nucleic acid-binding protein
MRNLFEALLRRPRSAVTSELSLAEVLVGVERQGSLVHKRMYLDLLDETPLFELVPVSRHVLLEAARYRAIAYAMPSSPHDDRRNFFPDSIHIVSAAEAGCRYFVSGDGRLRLPAGMTRVEPTTQGIDHLLERLT